MKAMMSNTLREIINDPKKNSELEKSISKLSSRGEGKESDAMISVGSHEYKIQFVEAEPPRKKHTA